MLKSISLMAAFCLFLIPSISSADIASKTDNPVLDVVFDAVEKELIGDYYKHETENHTKKENKAKGKSKSMPHGLAKKETLPPGLAKQIEVKGQLPPGLQKRDLPDDLLDRLPPAKEGTKRVIADGDVVLIEEATGLVLDVLRDVVNAP